MTSKRNLERRLDEIEPSKPTAELILYEDSAGRLYNQSGEPVDESRADPVVILRR